MKKREEKLARKETERKKNEKEETKNNFKFYMFDINLYNNKCDDNLKLE